MRAVALTASVLPGKTEEWREWSGELNAGSKRSEYLAVMQKTGVSRIRVWLQEDPQGLRLIVLYEGETPEDFLRYMGTSQEALAVWFRERVKETNGYDLAKPMERPPSELISDFQSD